MVLLIIAPQGIWNGRPVRASWPNRCVETAQPYFQAQSMPSALALAVANSASTAVAGQACATRSARPSATAASASRTRRSTGSYTRSAGPNYPAHLSRSTKERKRDDESMTCQQARSASGPPARALSNQHRQEWVGKAFQLFAWISQPPVRRSCGLGEAA
jgi:hypothetical protein